MSRDRRRRPTTNSLISENSTESATQNLGIIETEISEREQQQNEQEYQATTRQSTTTKDEFHLKCDVDNEMCVIVDSYGVSYPSSRELLVESKIGDELMTSVAMAMPSEEALDELIPSFPGSPRSFSVIHSVWEEKGKQASDPHLLDAGGILQDENNLLQAVLSGNEDGIRALLRFPTTNLQATDQLGRNALHLCVAYGSIRIIKMLLKAGVDATLRDNLDRTPLLICLMRRPSLKIVKLLFDHGARLLPRLCPVDTGLFLQFVMMSVPTEEDEAIMRYLVSRGALVDDPEAPGQRQALHFAAMSNNCRLIRVLHDLRANPFAKNHINETAREVAIKYQCREAAELLETIEKLTEPYSKTKSKVKAIGHTTMNITKETTKAKVYGNKSQLKADKKLKFVKNKALKERRFQRAEGKDKPEAEAMSSNEQRHIQVEEVSLTKVKSQLSITSSTSSMSCPCIPPIANTEDKPREDGEDDCDIR